jgi:hypothetical protein
VPGQLNRPFLLHDQQRGDVRLEQRQSLHRHEAKVYHCERVHAVNLAEEMPETRVDTAETIC